MRMSCQPCWSILAMAPRAMLGCTSLAEACAGGLGPTSHAPSTPLAARPAVRAAGRARQRVVESKGDFGFAGRGHAISSRVVAPRPSGRATRSFQAVTASANTAEFVAQEAEEMAALGKNPTLTSFLLSDPITSAAVDADLALLLGQIASAVKRIAAAAARLGIEEGLQGVAAGATKNVSGDVQKNLDVVADAIMMEALRTSGRVAVAASEESDDAIPLPTSAGARKFAVVFDPLDGSRNIDAGIPTGTIFGIYPTPPDTPTTPEAAAKVALQSGSYLLCAGYALYSSATVLVLSVGRGAHGFTFDPSLGEFVLTHHNIQMPKRGQIYSVNDARYFDWPEGLRRYIDTVRQGKGQTGKKYSARYICSLVGDFHRTMLYGGVAMNPRSHLRLVYEANPLSFIAEQAGGRGWDGHRRILDIDPEKLHQRLPLFLGSADDIAEMESFGDVRQEVNPGYEV